MLVLQRYIGESIRLEINGVEIVVQLLDIRGPTRAKIGVTAPRELVRISRVNNIHEEDDE